MIINSYIRKYLINVFGLCLYNNFANLNKEPNLSRTDTELVKEDIETDNEEVLQESDMSFSS
jgi:hypothetical protein